MRQTLSRAERLRQIEHLTTVRLSFNEAMTLFIASRLLARYADEYNPHTVSVLDKLATALPKSGADHIAQTAEAISINNTLIETEHHTAISAPVKLGPGS
jgi:hypothetical protein